MKKVLFGLLAATALYGVAQAQTFSDETKYNGKIGVRTAQHTSSTTGTYDKVPDTAANFSIIASSSTAGITATLTFSTKGASDSANGQIISTQALTLYTTPTEVSVTGPLKFQKVKLTMNAGGAATISDTRIYSRQ